MSVENKKILLEPESKELSIRRQCELLDLHRSNIYYEPIKVSEEKFKIMNRIDEIYTSYPFYGSRKITMVLRRSGVEIGRKHVQSLMREMGLAAIYPKRKLSKRNLEHTIYPYLLADVKIENANKVWSADITYIRLKSGFMYLTVVLDWYSRYVLSWRLSNTLEVDFCIEALDEALDKGLCEIFNTDQGSQFTSNVYINKLLTREIKISMDGKGRAFDNIFVERLWRTVKYEDVYINKYETVPEIKQGLKDYMGMHLTEVGFRIHPKLGK